jgi:hypothetical protein
VKIVNQTHFETRDLRAILQRAAVDVLEADKRRRVVVTVVYSRKSNGAASGCAAVGGTRCRIRVHKHAPRLDALAWVAVHEFRHLNGWTHAEMKGRYSFDDLGRYAWAATMPLRVRQLKPKARPAVADKLAHAVRMQARAASRLKRAQTIARKWAAKVRYYDRRAAAASSTGGAQ